MILSFPGRKERSITIRSRKSQAYINERKCFYSLVSGMRKTPSVIVNFLSELRAVAVI